MSTLRQLRKRAGWSQERAAVAAGVTHTTLRVFEVGGADAIKDEAKREALVRVYAGFGVAAELNAESTP